MQYALLINEDEAIWDNHSEEKQGEIMQGYAAFSEYLVANNHMLGGERLHPINTATTVRVRNGETLLTDGPFAETKEQFGGFYLVQAADLDEAIKLAAMIPTAKDGCVEVRPVWTMEDMQD
jgi:hypothetical protein